MSHLSPNVFSAKQALAKGERVLDLGSGVGDVALAGPAILLVLPVSGGSNATRA